MLAASLTVWLSLAACAGPPWGRLGYYLTQHPGTDPTVAYGLWHRCPVAGTPESALLAAFGRPSEVSGSGGEGVVWRYRQREGAQLLIRIADGRVADWRVEPPRGRPLSPYDVRGDRGAQRRVARILASGEQLAGKTIYELVSGCVSAGTAVRHVRATFGDAFVEELATPGLPQETIVVVRLGIEGQRLEIVAHADTVSSWRYAGPRRGS